MAIRDLGNGISEEGIGVRTCVGDNKDDESAGVIALVERKMVPAGNAGVGLSVRILRGGVDGIFAHWGFDAAVFVDGERV